MISFVLDDTGVVLEYTPELGNRNWVRDELDKGSVQIRRVFKFEKRDLVPEVNSDKIDGELDDFEEFVYRFQLANTNGTYYQIAGRKLSINNEVWIAKSEATWRTKLFVAERDISIFKHIAKLIDKDQAIIVGGEEDGAIPIAEFEGLIKRFPNTYELNRYAEARVSNIIGEYIQPQRDFRNQYETYLNKRNSTQSAAPIRAEKLLETEIEKFNLIRGTLKAWLDAGEKSEKDWQEKLLAILPLIFPKYIAVLKEVPIEDRYTTPGKVKIRKIDFALADANGNIDVVEIKKPENDILLRRSLYRDNHVPTGVLSGTIMQAEKYLFHLSKAGPAIEDKLTAQYAALLPPGLKIRITTPKAMLILGRETKSNGASALTPRELADFEVIKRKYANVIDIITYDDLLRRLDNIIASLERRQTAGL